MSATITQLGARVLRKIGVVIVPTANQPAPGATVPLIDLGARVLRACGVSFIATGDRLAAGATFGPADIASNVLRDFDIVTTEAERPPFTTTVSVTELGARSLRAVGVSFTATGARLSTGATYAQADIAALVLRDLGIVTTEAERPALSVTISQAEIAARALRAVGVNPFGPATAPSSETTYTLDQIATFALQHLGVISATETATSQDQALMLTKVGAAHETVTRLDIAAWLGSAVPARALPYYITMAAALCAASFGPRAEAATYAGAYEVAERKLLQIALSGVDGQNLALFKVAAVHDMLVAQGLAYWAVSAIPQAYAEEYVLLSAEMLAVVMGHVSDKRSSITTVGVGVDAQNRTVDMKAGEAAIGRIRQSGIVRGAYTRALDQVSQVHEQVSALGLATWPLSAVPPGIADAYRDLAVQDMGLSFERPVNEATNQAAWERLRRLALSSAAGQTLAEQRISSAHDALVAQGLVYWTLVTIPQAFADDYISLAAVQLAAVVSGQPPDAASQQAAWDGAAGHIKRAGIIRNAYARALSQVAQVHEEINATGLAQWPVTAIPQSVADAYQDLVTQNMGLSFGRAPVDQDANQSAWTRLRRLALSTPRGQLIAQQKVAEAQDAVAAQALAFWTIDTVPLSVASDLVAMAAILLLPVVTGQPSDPAVTQPAWDSAKEHIRKVCMLQNAQSLAEGKILAVHADLDVRGAIRWTIFDIPDYAEEPYVAMAAFLIAPEFGVQVDPNMWGGARKALARAVSVPAGREPIMMDAF